MAGVKVVFDADKLTNGMRLLFEDTFPKAVSRGLNNMAFSLRNEWVDIISRNVDKPNAFTKRKPLVEKSSPDNLQSRVFLHPIQASYLEHIMEGTPRVKGDPATLSSGSLVPIFSKLDPFGNFRGGPRKWIAQVGTDEGSKEQADAFVMGGRGSKNPRDTPLIFERLKGGQIALLAAIKPIVDYKVTLPLDADSETFINANFDSIMQKEISGL